MKEMTLKHEFVEFIPSELQDGLIYISIPYATAAHRCFCGCRNRVVTPISPTGWTLAFDGESISLSPSIGNWSFPCRSHYWIRRNRIDWAATWSKEQTRNLAGVERKMQEAHITGKQQQVGEKRRASPLKKLKKFFRK